MILQEKGHLTESGLQNVVNLRASLNKGLSDNLEKAFPLTDPYPRPVVVEPIIPDQNWIAGFATGEGCFKFDQRNSPGSKLKFKLSLCFEISQNIRDEILLRRIVEFLGCGSYVPDRSNNAGKYRVTKISDINENIIPFFNKYNI